MDSFTSGPPNLFGQVPEQIFEQFQPLEEVFVFLLQYAMREDQAYLDLLNNNNNKKS